VVSRDVASQYATGEISGQLDDTLRRLRIYYEEEGSRKLHAVAQWTPRAVYLVVVLLIAYQIFHFYLGYFGQIRDAAAGKLANYHEPVRGGIILQTDSSLELWQWTTKSWSVESWINMSVAYVCLPSPWPSGRRAGLLARQFTPAALCLISLGRHSSGVTVFAILPESLAALRWWVSWWRGSGYALFAVISKYVYHVCPACAASHFDEAPRTTSAKLPRP